MDSVHLVAFQVGVAHVERHLVHRLEIDRGERVDDQGAEEGAAVFVRAADVGLLIPLDGGIGTHGEPLLDLVVAVDLGGQALVVVLVALGHTVLVHVVEGDEVGAAVVAALGADGMALGDTGAVQDVGPPGVGHAVPLAAGDHVVAGSEAAGSEAHVPVDELFRVQDLGITAEGGAGVLEVVEDPAVLGLGTALGGDEDDTVTCLRTVDGGGSGVLQDLHGFDHGRIQVLDVVHFQTVHDHERSETGAAVGGDTADADVGLFARGAGVGVDLHAGGLALQGGGGVGGGTVHQFLRTDRRHRTGEVTLALDAVADDHGLLKELGIFQEDDVDDVPVTDRNHLGGIADAGDFDARAGRNAQAVRTVRAGDGADGRVADQHHGGSDDRNARAVNNRSPDCPVLGGYGIPARKDGKEYQDSRRSQQFFEHVGEWVNG